ncbi:hypothetical protein ZWY2020_054455 [Hordeum vulgare]|nr:hypothetical protein ZWY2020_054453 [Hordeum vulgare]KAI5021045.1 hypothetical protein ZWY2020_054455 [Hordeum vulgare]
MPVDDWAPPLPTTKSLLPPFGTPSCSSCPRYRSLCMGDPASRDCVACLTTATKKLTSCGASRRANVWSSEGCFRAYNDSNTSSTHEDAFLGFVNFGKEVYTSVISVDDGTPHSKESSNIQPTE